MSLGWKLVLQIVGGLLVFGAMLFVPAGSLDYWQGWAFLAVWFVPGIFFCIYYYKRDPAMLKRRLQTKEKEKVQKLIIWAVYVIVVVAFLIPGLDFRFGWSQKCFGPVPPWLELLSLGIALAAYLATVWVMDANRYAARTIQVEPGQQVVSNGPYKWVRHPMYSASIVMFLFTSLALGSYVALPAFLLVIPFFILRLLNEEKVLLRELPGYAEYCERTRYRLISYIW